MNDNIKLTLRCMPSTPMTQEEMEEQCRAVSEIAEVMEMFSDDELEAFIEERHGKL